MSAGPGRPKCPNFLKEKMDGSREWDGMEMNEKNNFTIFFEVLIEEMESSFPCLEV